MGAFSLVKLKLRHTRWVLKSHGLEERVVDLAAQGCALHLWTPQQQLPTTKPAVVLLHGFGGDGTFAWETQVPHFSKHAALFLPDLLFFGQSTVTMQNPEKQEQQEKHRYSEIFQAMCVYEALQKLGVKEAVVVGHSYGGFVAYRMAHLYPSFVKKVGIVSSGVTMNPQTNDPLLREFGSTRIHDMLVPPSLPLFKRSLRFVLNESLPKWLPTFLYKDLYESMSGDRQSRLQLVDDIVLGKEEAPALPRIQQEALIIWGEEDRIFNVSLAHQLKEFLGSNATLITLKDVGHVPQMVKPKEFTKILLPFLL